MFVPETFALAMVMMITSTVCWGSWANGANIQQANLNGSYAQDWWLQPVGDGYCRIVSRETGLQVVPQCSWRVKRRP